MTKINEKSIYKKREKLLLNFFFNVKSRIAIIFFVLFAAALAATFLTREFGSDNGLKIAHICLGSLSILLLLLFILSLLHVFNGNITYEELEQIIKNDREIAYSGLFQGLAIKNSKSDYLEAPIEVISPELYPGRNTIVYRYIKETNKVYYSQSGYSWLLFGEKRLFHYHASVNHIYGYVGFEVAQEISYSDIVNVKSEVVRQNKLETLTISLSLINGEVINIVLRAIPGLEVGSTHRLSELETKIITTIRQVIRDNK